MAVSVIAIIAFLYAASGRVTDTLGLRSSADDVLAPRLEVRQAKPINRPDIYASDAAAPVQTRPSTPQVAVTVRNKGEEPALLERVRVTIEDSARMPICPFVGPAGPVPGYPPRYPIRLPWLPTPDELIVRHEMQQEVAAGKVGHFVIFFRTPSDIAAAHLYALRIEVIAEGAQQPLDLGRFVVGVPGPVPRTGFYLPESEDVLLEAYESVRGWKPRLAVTTTWCYRRNLAEMRRVLAWPGRRAPAIAALAQVRLVRNWQRIGDSRPARVAIEPLMATQYLEGPALAVFAAESTGDDRLVERTHRRAAAQLAGWARQGIDEAYTDNFGLAYARLAYKFAPSLRARRLIRVLEARLLGAEELRASES